MFWIIGGKALILALASVLSVDLSEWLGHRMHHPEWDGFEPYDLIFPLFLFIAGVSTIYSIDNRLAKGDSRASLHRHFVQRGLILVLLGVFYNGLLSRDLASADGWGQMRYASVLGRIGLAYMFAALIASNTHSSSSTWARCSRSSDSAPRLAMCSSSGRQACFAMMRRRFWAW